MLRKADVTAENMAPGTFTGISAIGDGVEPGAGGLDAHFLVH